MVIQWAAGALKDWNGIIHNLELVYGIEAVKRSTAVRFKWDAMRPAHMLPPQDPTIFGVANFSSAMLVLQVDRAFQAADR